MLNSEERLKKEAEERQMKRGTISGYGVPQELPPMQLPPKKVPPDLPKEIVEWLSQ
jgi:hypothetical protein